MAVDYKVQQALTTRRRGDGPPELWTQVMPALRGLRQSFNTAVGEVYETLSELAPAAPPAAAAARLVLGRYSAGDGGGDWFQWVPGSTESADGIRIIASTYPEASGRWHRLYSGEGVSFAWWGPAADGIYGDPSAGQGAATTVGSPWIQVTPAAGKFPWYSMSTDDIGKKIIIPGAGNVGGALEQYLVATVIDYDSTTNRLRLDQNATATLVGAQFYMASDDQPKFQEALSYVQNTLKGGVLRVPPGIYGVFSTITLPPVSIGLVSDSGDMRQQPTELIYFGNAECISAPLLPARPYDSFLRVRGFRIYSQPNATKNLFITNVNFADVSNISYRSGQIGVHIDYVFTSKFESIVGELASTNGMWIRSCNFLWVDKCQIQRTFNYGSATGYPGWNIFVEGGTVNRIEAEVSGGWNGGMRIGGDGVNDSAGDTNTVRIYAEGIYPFPSDIALHLSPGSTHNDCTVWTGQAVRDLGTANRVSMGQSEQGGSLYPQGKFLNVIRDSSFASSLGDWVIYTEGGAAGIMTWDTTDGGICGRSGKITCTVAGSVMKFELVSTYLLGVGSLADGDRILVRGLCKTSRAMAPTGAAGADGTYFQFGLHVLTNLSLIPSETVKIGTDTTWRPFAYTFTVNGRNAGAPLINALLIGLNGPQVGDAVWISDVQFTVIKADRGNFDPLRIPYIHTDDNPDTEASGSGYRYSRAGLPGWLPSMSLANLPAPATPHDGRLIIEREPETTQLVLYDLAANYKVTMPRRIALTTTQGAATDAVAFQLPNSSTVNLEFTVTAYRTGGVRGTGAVGDYACFVRRTAANIVGGPGVPTIGTDTIGTDRMSADFALGPVSVAIVAAANNIVKLQVTGMVDTTIRWETMVEIRSLNK